MAKTSEKGIEYSIGEVCSRKPPVGIKPPFLRVQGHDSLVLLYFKVFMLLWVTLASCAHPKLSKIKVSKHHIVSRLNRRNAAPKWTHLHKVPKVSPHIGFVYMFGLVVFMGFKWRGKPCQRPCARILL